MKFLTMNNLDKHELIDKFLSDQLSQADKVTFDDLIENDINFSKEIDKTRSANNAIHQLGLLNTSKKLDQIHKKNIQSRFRMWITRSVATAIILLGSYGIYKVKKNDLSSNTPNTLKTESQEITKATEPTTEELSQKTITIDINKTTPTSPYTDYTKNKTVNSITTTEVFDTSSIKTNSTANNRLTDTVPPTVSKKTETVFTPEQPNKTTIICNNITLKHRTLASCAGKENGEIIYSNESFSGGIPPYESYIFKLGNRENPLVKNQLAAGKYLIKVIDAKECVDTIPNITISEKRCIQRIDYNFSPKYGEVWEYPQFNENSTSKLTIKDMSNFTVLEKQISFDEESSWGGTLENGAIIKKGVYLIEIESNHETYAVGTITIIE